MPRKIRPRREKTARRGSDRGHRAVRRERGGKGLDLSSGSVLVAFMNGLQAMVPAAEDVLKEGDVVYAMVSQPVRKKFVRILTK